MRSSALMAGKRWRAGRKSGADWLKTEGRRGVPGPEQGEAGRGDFALRAAIRGDCRRNGGESETGEFCCRELPRHVHRRQGVCEQFVQARGEHSGALQHHPRVERSVATHEAGSQMAGIHLFPKTGMAVREGLGASQCDPHLRSGACVDSPRAAPLSRSTTRSNPARPLSVPLREPRARPRYQAALGNEGCNEGGKGRAVLSEQESPLSVAGLEEPPATLPVPDSPRKELERLLDGAGRTCPRPRRPASAAGNLSRRISGSRGTARRCRFRGPARERLTAADMPVAYL